MLIEHRLNLSKVALSSNMNWNSTFQTTSSERRGVYYLTTSHVLLQPSLTREQDPPTPGPEGPCLRQYIHPSPADRIEGLPIIFCIKTRSWVISILIRFENRDFDTNLTRRIDPWYPESLISGKHWFCVFFKFPNDGGGGDGNFPTTLPSGQTPGPSSPGTKCAVQGNFSLRYWQNGWFALVRSI